MDYTTRFWAAWRQFLLALPHPRQVEVMINPGGDEWRELARRAAEEAEK